MWCPVPEPDAPETPARATTTDTAGAQFGFGSPRRAGASSRFVSFDAELGSGEGGKKGGKGALSAKKGGGGSGGSGTKRKAPAAKKDGGGGGSSTRKPEFDLSDDDDFM
jgi:hypothetical protein